jgi:hypothetical protein
MEEDDTLSVEECFQTLADQFDGASVRMKRSSYVFKAAAVMPKACILAWQYCRKLLIFDGAHLSSKHGGILLLATTQDANNNTLILA